MAVAVKNASEPTSAGAFDRLAVASLAGVVFVLGSLGVVFYALPALWSASVARPITQSLGSFINAGLLVVVMLAAAVGLVVLGGRLVGPKPAHGLRAGIGIGIVSLLLIGWTTWLFGLILENTIFTGDGTRMIGLLITAALGLGLVFLFLRMFLRPSFEATLGQIEEQGWFSRTIYKGSQGLRVRRGTLVGILILGVCGIWTLHTHNTLVTYAAPAAAGGGNDWVLTIPFTGGYYIPILKDVKFTVPLLLLLLTFWVAFRAVNFPAFADFLIATEAELNKVSWTTRRRLYQDTIVVLVTVVLLTVFLMVVDIAWGWLLSRKWVGVIQVDQTQSKPEDELQPW